MSQGPALETCTSSTLCDLRATCTSTPVRYFGADKEVVKKETFETTKTVFFDEYRRQSALYQVGLI